MAIMQLAPPPPRKSGGLLGEIGQDLGGLANVAGVIAAPFTGGASLGVGSSVGGALNTIGSTIDPGKTVQPTAPSPLQSMQDSHGVQLARLNDLDTALRSNALVPQDEYSKISAAAKQAREALMQRMGRG